MATLRMSLFYSSVQPGDGESGGREDTSDRDAV
jgi:hypothetical protein